MKETLDEQSRNELVKYRLERAEETLREADLLAGEGFYNATINRLYYACFYSVMALLVKHSITATSHSGVKSARVFASLFLSAIYILNGRKVVTWIL